MVNPEWADIRRVFWPRVARRARSLRTNSAERDRDPDACAAGRGAVAVPAAEMSVAVGGERDLWENPPYNPADPHNPMLDRRAACG